MNALPTDWIGLAGVALITVGGWVTAWLQSRRGRVEVSQVAAKVTDVHEQVANSHSTNLRDDLDEIKRDIADMRGRLIGQGYDIGGLRQDIGGLRGELRGEREFRIELQRRLDEHLRTPNQPT